jgi:nondiscriminating aspartyl-tRNA synthetase
MERTLSSELRSHVGERVRLAGWLHHRRQLSRLTFVLIRDRAGIAQVVVEEPAVLEQVEGLLPETVLEVEGEVVAGEQAPCGIEVRDPVFRVLASVAEAPLIELRRPALKEQLPTILDNAAVALRHPRERAKFRIAAASVAGYRAALDRLGFTEIHTPKLVGVASESGTNLFTVDYFERPAYLAQSPQLYKQILVGAFERVFEVGPVFRAEPHDTARHLAEYVSLDAEVGFVEDHRTVMAIAREAVAGMVDGVHERAEESVALLGIELPEVPAEIPVTHFADTGVDDVDLAPADERRLSAWAKRSATGCRLTAASRSGSNAGRRSSSAPATSGRRRSSRATYTGLRHRPTRATISSTASLCRKPRRRTSERQVSNSSAWPSAARSRLGREPRFDSPAARRSTAAE